MIEKVIIVLFTELRFFLLCYILWKFVVELIALGIIDLFSGMVKEFEETYSISIFTDFIVAATIAANFLNYRFVIIGTSFDITCSWQSHFITFTERFFVQKLEFLVNFFKSLVSSLKTVGLEFLKFHSGVTCDIESFLHTFIASSTESDYTAAGIYISKFLKFPNDVTSNIGSFLHNLIASSTESSYTWAGISVLLFVIFIYGYIWCGSIWSKVFTVIFELIGALFEYLDGLVGSLQYDEILCVLFEVDPLRAYLLVFVRIFQGIHSNVENLLVLFPIEQYSWFYFFYCFGFWTNREIFVMESNPFHQYYLSSGGWYKICREVRHVNFQCCKRFKNKFYFISWFFFSFIGLLYIYIYIF